MLRRLIKPVLVVLLAAGIFGLGLIAARSSAQPQADAKSDLIAKYPLLSRRIFLDNPNDSLLNFIPLRKALKDRLASVNAPYSFSFEYLPTGTSIRSGGEDELIGASLLKLPVVMNLYREAESGNVSLDEVQTITQNELNGQFGNLFERGAGAKITLREAARYALEKSDNTAILVIQNRLVHLPAEPDALEAVDAEYDAQAAQVLINSRSYASVLKCLFFACYLNRDDSEELLSYLTKSDFNSGIAKSIPEDVKIAHKIGVEAVKLSQSDCGIIYLPRRPYVLCIMVGLPVDQADQLMVDLSGLVYQTLSHR